MLHAPLQSLPHKDISPLPAACLVSLLFFTFPNTLRASPKTDQLPPSPLNRGFAACTTFVPSYPYFPLCVAYAPPHQLYVFSITLDPCKLSLSLDYLATRPLFSVLPPVVCLPSPPHQHIRILICVTLVGELCAFHPFLTVGSSLFVLW